MDSDEESFRDWVTGAQPGLLRVAVLLTGDSHRAEDLVQEALVKVALRWRRLRDERPYSYATKVMVRDNISWWRRHRRETVTEVEPMLQSANDLDRLGQRQLLRQALAGLTPRQRAVLVLRYYEDLSEKQVAALMGTSVGTVKSQTHLALRRLRENAPELAGLLEDVP